MILYNCCLRCLVCVDNVYFTNIIRSVQAKCWCHFFVFSSREGHNWTTLLNNTPQSISTFHRGSYIDRRVATVNGKGANHIRSGLFGPALGYSWNIGLQEHALPYCFKKTWIRQQISSSVNQSTVAKLLVNLRVIQKTNLWIEWWKAENYVISLEQKTACAKCLNKSYFVNSPCLAREQTNIKCGSPQTKFPVRFETWDKFKHSNNHTSCA